MAQHYFTSFVPEGMSHRDFVAQHGTVTVFEFGERRTFQLDYSGDGVYALVSTSEAATIRAALTNRFAAATSPTLPARRVVRFEEVAPVQHPAPARRCDHDETDNHGICYACGAYVPAGDAGRYF